MKTVSNMSTTFVGAALFLLLSLSGHAFATGLEAQNVMERYGKLPLHFEANTGQTNHEVKFLSRGRGYSVFLTSTEAVLALKTASTPAPAVVTMRLVGAKPGRITGVEELPGKANYFIGNDPTKWRANVPTYAKVHYENVYRGIDLIYYGNERQLEYDFIVHPGADPRHIRLTFQGADRLEVDARGDLVMHTAAGEIHQRKPVIYQEVDGVRHEIQGGYVLKGPRRVGFQVAAFDPSRPLIIDPTLVYSTFLGGSGNESASGIAVDAAGNAYVTGVTSSLNFPTTLGAVQTASGGGGFADAFVTKLDPTGSTLVYSTYLGGSGNDRGLGIVVDGIGNAYVTGGTDSTNFPTTRGAMQATSGGGNDAFVAKLNPAGSALVYSTYLGGTGSDQGVGISVDAAGNAYVSGVTGSTHFPTTPGAVQTTFGGIQDAFVTKLDPSGSTLVYSTYLGGSGNDASLGIVVDAVGSAYVTGGTNSPNFPTTAGAVQTSPPGGGGDAFVTKLDPAGSALAYSTYLGGSAFDQSFHIAVDAVGSVYLTGITNSMDFPTTTGAVQTTSGGSGDAFVTKLNATGSALVYSTYLGGGGGDEGVGIAVDAAGNAYGTGFTDSTNFPTTAGAVQTTLGGGADAFMTKLDPTGSTLVYSTYLGGSGSDLGLAIVVDGVGNVYVTGAADSTNFPTTPGAFQTTSGGS